MRPRSSILLVFVALLATMSVVTLRSIDQQYALNQLIFFGLGTVAFLLISSLPALWLHRWRWWAYGGVVALLILTLVIGRATNGSTSWLRIGSFRLQASELAKPVVVLALAGTLPRTRRWQRRELITFGCAAIIPVGLILRQPDLGTTLMLLSAIGTLWLSTAPRKKTLLRLALSLLALSIIAWMFVLKPYQKDRILTFTDPTRDPRGSGYNARQALIAVGSGGWWGRGFGNGLQSHLRFLPERHTDFLFASFAEEAGFIGSSLLLIIYVGLLWHIVHIAESTPSLSEHRVVLALAAMLFAQIAVNIGMNIGLAPITGVTLPLMSLGGSSILATLASLGVVESIRRSNLHE